MYLVFYLDISLTFRGYLFSNPKFQKSPPGSACISYVLQIFTYQVRNCTWAILIVRILYLAKLLSLTTGVFSHLTKKNPDPGDENPRDIPKVKNPE